MNRDARVRSQREALACAQSDRPRRGGFRHIGVQALERGVDLGGEDTGLHDKEEGSW